MATTQAKPRPITGDELLGLNSEGVRGELIRGVLCEMPPPGIEHGRILMRLGAFLFNFVDAQNLGTVLAGDPGIWIEREPDTVRAPDVAYYSAERMSPDATIPGYAEIVPNLVVEIVSPNDTVSEMNDKARMWIDTGVSLVWVVWPNWQTVEVHRRDEGIIELSGDAVLEGADVVPGFAVPITNIFGS